MIVDLNMWFVSTNKAINSLTVCRVAAPKIYLSIFIFLFWHFPSLLC